MIFFQQHTRTSISRLNSFEIKFQEHFHRAEFQRGSFTHVQTSPILSSKYKILPQLTIFLLAFICFCWLPPLLKIFIWANLFVKVAVAPPYIGKNHAIRLRKTLNRAFESTNYKHKNTGAGSISEGPGQPFRPSNTSKLDTKTSVIRSNKIIFEI